MLKISPPYCLPFGVSIFFHIILLILFTINLSSSNTYRINNPSSSVTFIKNIKAETVSQTVIDNEINAMKIAKKQKHEAKQACARGLKEKIQVLKKQKIAKQKRLTDLHMKQLHIKQKKKQEAVVRKKELDLRKQQQKITYHRIVSKQQKLQQQLLQKEIQREQTQVAKMCQTEQNQRILDRYKAQIIQVIQQQWIMPVNTNKNLFCILLIRLAPGGAVLSVTTLQSSGDPVLDRSARVAVFKASPLPVPQDSSLFSQFHELRLTARPLQVKANTWPSLHKS
ncbi:cell envelope integrity protein TolA [Coxiella endosymbiont of Dermacentor marginatus]|uniref:cell envelope integrity protein TolA n=1 Tax=Coxiella endosymbiont of Dermacentor marginatus TaxID=1656159 RepID=UPI0022228617|nr:cell envelope integrity protein TolA [Coxiella endosymbiont of Dermacentor marginatus]